MAEKYYVMMIDIVGSSKLPDRDTLIKKLDAAISQVNTAYSKDLWAPFEVTKGDEVAAVLTSVARAYEMIDIFSEVVFPVALRSVIVYDELTAGLDTRRSTVIDGPAFYRGNRMMIKLKKTQKTFALRSRHKELDEATEALVNFLLWRWNNLTKLQRQIVQLYQQERNQSRVAKMLNRKQQQVQNTLEACKWQIIDDAENAVRYLFQFIDRHSDDRR